MNVVTELDYDDVLLRPTESEIDSRDDVVLESVQGNLFLDIPIIASPMRGIVGPAIVTEMDRLGGVGILPRFYTDIHQWHSDIANLSRNCGKWGAAVGLEDYDTAEIIINSGANIICVDVANGYLKNVKNFCRLIADIKGKTLLMAGNVTDREGAKDLYNAGVDIVRVGIGSGQLCTTRIVTGVGRPQLSALYDCTDADRRWNIVSDGGISNSGRAVKSFAFGANYVMLGTLLSQAFESEHDGRIHGQASREIQEIYYDSVKSVEGISKDAEKTCSLEELITEFTYNIRSAMTYLNCKYLDDLNYAEYYVVK